MGVDTRAKPGTLLVEYEEGEGTVGEKVRG